MKFQRHACASSRIITPELTTQSCWLFKWRFFKYQYWYLKKSWCALICSSVKKKCLYKWEERKRSSTIFVKIPYTNSASVSGVAEKIDKFFTLVPEGRSIDTSSLSISFTQWYRIIFHLPEVVGIVFES